MTSSNGLNDIKGRFIWHQTTVCMISNNGLYDIK